MAHLELARKDEMIEFDEYAEFLLRSATKVKPELMIDGEAIGEEQKQIARDMIGRENPQWPPLADTTIDEKTRLGYGGQVSATDPLLRTGALRESIDFNVDDVARGIAITLGSDDKVALYQELGTTTIPPRPFLSTAQMESVEPATKLLGETAVDLLVPTSGRALRYRKLALPPPSSSELPE